jgi:hypothetical protein
MAADAHLNGNRAKFIGLSAGRAHGILLSFQGQIRLPQFKSNPD